MANTYDEMLSTAKDHARFHLGDVGPSYELSDETILSMLAKFGWSKGLENLARGLLTIYSKEPVKYDEGGGVVVDLSARIDQLERLVSAAASGSIPDPDVVAEATVAVGKSTRANTVVHW